jgi:type I restriction enzyme S subunit
MTALVTKHLPLVAGAPDGVNMLRSLLRELAVRGRLTQQNPADEHADVLLNRIVNQRLALAESVRQKTVRNFAEVLPTDRPFPIPLGWAFDRLGAVAALITKGTTPTTLGFAYATSGIRFVKVEDVQSGRVQGSYGATYIGTDANEALARSKLAAGDVLFSIAGTIGKTCLIYETDLPANTNQAFAIIRGAGEIFDLHFLRLQLDSFVAEKTRRRARGGAMPNVSLGDLSDLIVVVPPLAEQNRIVAKIDELMALCDRLEADQADAGAAHAQLVQALLDSLAQATDAADFRASWQRLSEHFHPLFTTEASIDALKQTVLQLAVMGKLAECGVATDPLIANLPPLATEDAPFGLQPHWQWVRLGAICDLVTSGSRGWREFYADSGSVFIRSQDIKTDKLEFDKKAFVQLPPSAEGARTLVARGDLLITITGANVGKAAHITEDIYDAYVSQHVALVRLKDARFGQYLHRWLINSYGGRALLLASSYGAKPGLNLQNIKDLPVPLPPLTEQRRIVAKVDELMALCDQLKAQLAEARQQHAQLATALVEQAVA